MGMGDPGPTMTVVHKFPDLEAPRISPYGHLIAPAPYGIDDVIREEGAELAKEAELTNDHTLTKEDIDALGKAPMQLDPLERNEFYERQVAVETATKAERRRCFELALLALAPDVDDRALGALWLIAEPE